MQMPWISSSSSLPGDDAPIEFVLDDRGVPMGGAYANGIFHTRWAEYSVGRVRVWRTASVMSATEEDAEDHA